MPIRQITIALLACTFCAGVPSAHAAEYRVVQCGAAGAAHDFLAASSDPGLYAQDKCSTIAAVSLAGVAGSHTKPNGAVSWNAFAPDGTTFSFWEAAFQGSSADTTATVYARACATLSCSSPAYLFFGGLENWGRPAVKRWEGSGVILLQFALHCTGIGSTDGCTLGRAPGADMFAPQINLTDHYGPSTPILTGGTLPGTGWQSSRQPQFVAFSASDRGGGIDHISINIDEAAAKSFSAPCARAPGNGAYTRLAPCPLTTSGSLPIDISTLSDGVHSMSLVAVDAADQANTAGPYQLRVDNSPPTPPQNLSIVGGNDWHASDGFTIRWDLPAGQHAPIVATRWRLCPVEGGGTCRSGRTTNLTELPAVAVGASGEYVLRSWLEDAAGNQSESNASTTSLRLDSEPPRPVFEVPPGAAPRRISVRVDDGDSGLSDGEVEMRRADTSVWVALETTVSGEHLIAQIDDEQFEDGSYELRARAVDKVGNVGVTTSRSDGTKATVELPIRTRTRLTAGTLRTIVRRVSVRRSGKRHRIIRRHTVFVRRLRTWLGKQVQFQGALTGRDGAPLAGADIEVSSDGSYDAEKFRDEAVVHTDEQGRFTYRTRAATSRVIRFHYAGSQHLRGSTADVRVGVAATSTIHASNRSVRNGDTVAFTGRLRTLPTPAEGKLLEMQAFFRDRWRTFSTVRTDSRGRWSFDYTFGGTVGRVLYRFRAQIPYENGYRFETGRSRVAAVIVRGP